MPTETFRVSCDLGIHRFDDPRRGLAAAEAAFVEARRLGRLDDRVHSTRRWRRGRCVRITVTLVARTSWEAFDLGRAILRTAVHATGGATAGWEALVPTVGTSRRIGSRRRARSDMESPAPAASQEWASLSAAARRRLGATGPLPPLGPAGGGDRVVDIRHR